MKAFHWSLRDLDETDIESLIPFVQRLSGPPDKGTEQMVYVDQVSWL